MFLLLCSRSLFLNLIIQLFITLCPSGNPFTREVCSNKSTVCTDLIFSGS